MADKGIGANRPLLESSSAAIIETLKTDSLTHLKPAEVAGIKAARRRPGERRQPPRIQTPARQGAGVTVCQLTSGRARLSQRAGCVCGQSSGAKSKK